MKKRIIFIVFALAAQLCFSEDLLIKPEDLRLVFEEGKKISDQSGYHLFIRKKNGIESVMLTETTKDLNGNSDNYAYRALEYNPINGDEKRLLNGKFLESKYSLYSLIDSTPEQDEFFGQAFHIYIPAEIAYGYEWSRNGTVKINKGTFINIRAFEKKYGDYSGNFLDNPFMFDLGTPIKKQKTEPPLEQKNEPLPEIKEPIFLTDDYNPAAAASFMEIAASNDGLLQYSKGPETLLDDIKKILENITPKEKVDVVFAIDSTGSMKDDIQKLREEWEPKLSATLSSFKNIRIGLLLYRDYCDTYKLMGLPVKKFEFTDSIEKFIKYLNSFKIYGSEGGDLPEAVYEALYASLTFYNWRKDATKKIILIGDAEPHPEPKGTGKYTKALVTNTSKEKNITIDAIILPDDKTRRGR